MNCSVCASKMNKQVNERVTSRSVAVSVGALLLCYHCQRPSRCNVFSGYTLVVMDMIIKQLLYIKTRFKFPLFNLTISKIIITFYYTMLFK